VETIVDPEDPRLADFRALADADVRPDRRGVVIAEGTSVVERLLGSLYRVRAVVGVDTKMRALAPALAAAGAGMGAEAGSGAGAGTGTGVPAYVVDKWVLSEAVGFRVTRGVLASADRPAPLDPEQLVGPARRVAVLEQLNDFENLGALFRNAAAFGVDAVLLDPRTADPLYRRSVRVSMGHVLRVPFARLPAPWPDGLNVLRERGFRVLAMTPRASATPLAAVLAPARWAVLLGAEGEGLTEAALAAADEHVRIPMARGVDSLNVATAAAVVFSHLTA
jgi:tRNA G18 (ribose-2'-O)-methylase SpoU